MAVQYAQGSELPHFRQLGQQIREETRQALVQTIEQTLAQPVKNAADFVAKLKAAGYEGQASEPGKVMLTHEQTGATFPISELRPNGQALGPQLTAAVERTAQQTKDQVQDRGQSRGGGIGM
jgi:hypothetical protein